eukprot:6552422-Prymnesium_polylepis.1
MCVLLRCAFTFDSASGHEASARRGSARSILHVSLWTTGMRMSLPLGCCRTVEELAVWAHPSAIPARV